MEEQLRNQTYCEIALDMLNELSTDKIHSRLNPELERRLERIDELVGWPGGEVASRQVVAVVIEQWEREHSNV